MSRLRRSCFAYWFKSFAICCALSDSDQGQRDGVRQRDHVLQGEGRNERRGKRGRLQRVCSTVGCDHVEKRAGNQAGNKLVRVGVSLKYSGTLGTSYLTVRRLQGKCRCRRSHRHFVAISNLIGLNKLFPIAGRPGPGHRSLGRARREGGGEGREGAGEPAEGDGC